MAHNSTVLAQFLKLVPRHDFEYPGAAAPQQPQAAQHDVLEPVPGDGGRAARLAQRPARNRVEPVGAGLRRTNIETGLGSSAQATGNMEESVNIDTAPPPSEETANNEAVTTNRPTIGAPMNRRTEDMPTCPIRRAGGILLCGSD